MRLKKGDTVKVIAGREKGKTGTIELILHEKGKAIVGALNKVKRHRKPSKAYPQGGIVSLNAPINLSNLSFICTHCKKITRLGVKLNESGKSRICRKCQETV